MDIFAQQISKKILNDLFENNSFEIREDFPNKEYLETHLLYLERMLVLYKNSSENPSLQPRARCHSRDLMQNCIGLINGIKYALSFLDYKDVNLFEYDENNAVEVNVGD